MFAAYDDEYQKIGAILHEHLPSGWETSWTQVEMTAQSSSVIVYYRSPGAAPHWISPPLALYDRFRAMYLTAVREAPQAVWTQLTFVLHADDRFNVDFGYDPVPIEDESARLEIWKKKYLG